MVPSPLDEEVWAFLTCVVARAQIKAAPQYDKEGNQCYHAYVKSDRRISREVL